MGPHVDADLLAYLDGELDARARARVEAHLSACGACAAELEQLRALRQELDLTLDAALGPVRLPATADRRIRAHLLERAAPRRPIGLWRLRVPVAQALLAVLVAISIFATRQVLPQPLPAGPLQTLVLGQDRLAPGSRAALRVIVQSEAGARPVAGAKVVVRLGRAPGLARTVFDGYTGPDGSADVAFEVPADLEGGASLVVETVSESGESRIVRPITIAREARLYLSSDKPAYRPGQVVHLRALALDAVDLQPVVNGEVGFALIGPEPVPNRQVLARCRATTSEFGIASCDLTLPTAAVDGRYVLRATLPGTLDTVSQRSVMVGAYELPAFRLTLETARTFYAPGERVEGWLQADYFFGRPLANGEVTLRGSLGQAEQGWIFSLLGRTDAAGRFDFAFDLPDNLAFPSDGQPLALDLQAELSDSAGQRVGIGRPIPVAAQPILIRAIPESGLIKPGVENALFILTAYPDGQPAATVLTATLQGQRYTLSTGAYGLAELRAVLSNHPMQDVRLDVQARDAQGAAGTAAFLFQGDRAPNTLLLRAERAAYEVGQTLQLEALTAGIEQAGAPLVYLDVVRAHQTVATLSAPAEGGRARFAIDLDGGLAGTLELHAYYLLPDGTPVSDTRLVMVDAPRQVDLVVSADRETYRPGDTAHLQFRASLTSTGSLTGAAAVPVQAALGISVVDASLAALEDQPPGFVRTYFLLEQQLLAQRVAGFDPTTLLDARDALRLAQDTAAKASWAGAQGSDYTLSTRSRAVQPRTTPARQALARGLALVLTLLPLLLGALVLAGLGATGVFVRALRRVALGVLALSLLSPLVALLGGGLMLLLWALLGSAAPLAVLAAVAALWAALAVHGWRRRDARVQLAAGVLGAYLTVGGLAVYLAANGGTPEGGWLAALVLAFLLLLAALAVLGQGLLLEGWQGPGWAATLLALLLVVLVIYLPFVPGLGSDLTRTLGHPALYAGPAGWLTGCGMASDATAETIIVEVTPEGGGEVAVVTATPPPLRPTQVPAEGIDGALTEEPTEEPTEEATEEPWAELPTERPTEGPTEEPTQESAQTVTPRPTQTPAALAPAPTPTQVTPVAEPYPLRQVFPETLYWDPQALTAADGRLSLDLPLADSVTTWRLAALASTHTGELGVATYDLVVFQDFFVEVDLPPSVRAGDTFTATVTVYNYLPQAQAVRLVLAPSTGYTLLSPAAALALDLPPGGAATTALALRAERAGRWPLLLTADGEQMSDAVVGEVQIGP